MPTDCLIWRQYWMISLWKPNSSRKTRVLLCRAPQAALCPLFLSNQLQKLQQHVLQKQSQTFPGFGPCQRVSSFCICFTRLAAVQPGFMLPHWLYIVYIFQGCWPGPWLASVQAWLQAWLDEIVFGYLQPRWLFRFKHRLLECSAPGAGDMLAQQPLRLTPPL